MYQDSQVFEDLVHLTNLLLDLLYPLLSFLDDSFIKYNLIVQQYKFLSAINQSKHKSSQQKKKQSTFVCIKTFTFSIPQEAHAALNAYLHSHLSHWMYSYIEPKLRTQYYTKPQKTKHKPFWIMRIYLDGGEGLVKRGA